jgi:hypothetical protein
VARSRKSREESFARFKNEVLDVLDMKRTDEGFKREVLGKVVLWHPTGHFGVRYHTHDAKVRRPGGKLQRDHAHTRQSLVNRIFAEEDLEKVFEDAGVLVRVTPKGHERLREFASEDGWDRYRKAGLVVLEIESGKPVV